MPLLQFLPGNGQFEFGADGGRGRHGLLQEMVFQFRIYLVDAHEQRRILSQ